MFESPNLQPQLQGVVRDKGVYLNRQCFLGTSRSRYLG